MKKNNTFVTIAVVSLLAVILCCASWCTTGLGVMGVITMAFAAAFTASTYLASRGTKDHRKVQPKAAPVAA